MSGSFSFFCHTFLIYLLSSDCHLDFKALVFFQDEQVPTESTITSLLEENKILLQELDDSREQLEYLQKQYEEFVMKSKADVDLFVKEIKSLRGTQSDLRQECSQMMKEKSELEVDFSFPHVGFMQVPSGVLFSFFNRVIQRSFFEDLETFRLFL